MSSNPPSNSLTIGVSNEHTRKAWVCPLSCLDPEAVAQNFDGWLKGFTDG